MRKIYLSLLPVFFALPTFGQEILPFRLDLYNPKTINAAFTAKDEEQHLTLMGSGFVPNNKNESIESNSLISYEKYFKKINSGIGLQFNNSFYHYNEYNSNRAKTFGLFYRYKIKVSDNSSFSIGTGIKIASTTNYYTDAWDRYSTEDANKKLVKPDIDLGIAFQYKKFYTGISYNHVNKPTFTIMGDEYLIDYYNAVYNIYVGQRLNLAKWFSVESTVLYRGTKIYYSDQFKELDLNIQTRITAILLGGGYSYTRYKYSYYTDFRYPSYVNVQRYYASLGIRAFKKLELISLLYSNLQRNGMSFPMQGFHYEFMAKVKF